MIKTTCLLFLLHLFPLITFAQKDYVINDFNFDGITDTAIFEGYNSCYHGPSYEIYLKKGDTLLYSPEFTKLTQEYCGMFDLNYETKTIHTMVKSGCCWHEYSTFKVINNIPKLISILEHNEDDFPYQNLTNIKWDGDTKIEYRNKIIDFELGNMGCSEPRIIKLLSCELTNKKRIILFKTHVFNYLNHKNGWGWELNYVILKPNGTVESSNKYYHPFEINKKKNKLTFEVFEINENGEENDYLTTYEIYEHTKKNMVSKIKISITDNDEKYNWLGNIKSLEGTLKNFNEKTMSNLYIL